MLARRPSASAPPVQHRTVTIDRLRFHCVEWGAGTSSIVLVHATGFHAYVWRPIAENLGRDYRVIAVDQRGHGDSDKPESGYAWEVFGDDLYHVLTRLHVTPIVAVGHSAGATAIALCAAAHPGLMRRAVLIDPILFPRAPEGQVVQNSLAHRARKRRMVWESRTAMFHSYRVREPFKLWREDVLWAYIEEGTVLRADGHIELKCPGAIEAQVYEMAPRLDGFGILGQVTIPVLLLRGESSEAFPETSATYAHSLLPHAELKTIARSTHFVPMERPDAVERAVRRFVSS
jgi:pimeloyl-ACP methyl ester carboxylesterase